jgi:hypothetical protein
MMTKWHISGDYILACNCDYGCPCNFNAPPTPGFCEGSVGFLVEEGAYGDVRLDGLKAFQVVKWPGAIHEGDGTAAFYIDESATADQREALINIISGRAGGQPFEILASTYSKVLEPRFVKIDMNVAGKDTEVAVDGLIKIRFEPIRNPVTQAESFPKVVLPQGFIFKEGDQYSLEEFWVKDGDEFDFAYPGKCAELAKVRWEGP